MARIRSLKPEIWMSPQVMNLQHDARLLFIGLITQADDEGRGTADHRRLKAAIFGGDDITSADVQRMLGECVRQGLAVIYETESHGLIYALPGWGSHQSIDRPRRSSYPAPPSRGVLGESSPKAREGSEGGKDLGRREGRIVPTRARANPSPVDSLFAIDQIRAVYPPGTYAEANWTLAERNVAGLLDAGESLTDLLQAATAYRAQMDAKQSTGTQFVKSPENFYGREAFWRGPFPLPLAKGEQRQEANIAASREWLAGGGNG